MRTSGVVEEVYQSVLHLVWLELLSENLEPANLHANWGALLGHNDDPRV